MPWRRRSPPHPERKEWVYGRSYAILALVNESTILGVGRAVGKVILFGEHAVVYGRPALAVPVTQVWAEATVEPAAPGAGLTIYAADLGETIALRTAPADHPLAVAVRLALRAARTLEAADELSEARSHLGPSGRGTTVTLPPSEVEPDWRVTIRSTIPVASGLGSGAAVSAAIIRAIVAAYRRSVTAAETHRADAHAAPVATADENLTAESAEIAEAFRFSAPSASSAVIFRAVTHAGLGVSAQPPCGTADENERRSLLRAGASPGARISEDRQAEITPAALSELVYEVERLHHGTPSGIDNTVIAYQQPVYFVRGQPPEPFAIKRPFTLVIADTGIRSPTRIAVGDVRAGWQAQPARFEALFDRIAMVVEAARAALAAGEPEKLGPLMDENHALLREIGVSCPELEMLVTAARMAGASGAKLSGAGRGGNMIALVTAETAAPVAEALSAAGATNIIVTEVAA